MADVPPPAQTATAEISDEQKKLLIDEHNAKHPHHPVTTKRELLGWYAYDWANSAISSVAISGFLPLLVQECAQAAAGFPAVCGNWVRNATAALEVFGADSGYDSLYAYDEPDPLRFPTTKCTQYDVYGYGTHTWCPGSPANADTCLTSTSASVDDIVQLVVHSGGRDWNPAAYVAACVSISVALQMLVFISVSAAADHGPHRKRLMFVLSNLGSIFTIAAIGVTPDSWAFGGFLMVIINLLYGTTYTLYNAWLPMLAGCDATVLTAPVGNRDAVFQRTMDKISSSGFAYGYLGSVICLLICVGITVVSSSSVDAYRINVLISGLWWFFFAIFTWRFLNARPGPQLAAGANYITLPWKNLAKTVRHASHLPQTFAFLLTWFLYSDGFSVISNVGALYANSSVNWDPLPKSLGLAALLVIVPIAAGIGGVFWQKLEDRYRLGAKKIIIINNIIMALVPAYGLLGFSSNRALGFRRGWELLVGVIAYGFNLGSVQAFSRSAFGAMIPEGKESEFYALFEFTDRGSSWIGPAVVSSVIQSTGNIRGAFVYPLVALLLPSIILATGINLSKAEAEAKRYAKLFHTAKMATRGGLSVVAKDEPIDEDAAAPIFAPTPAVDDASAVASPSVAATNAPAPQK